MKLRNVKKEKIPMNPKQKKKKIKIDIPLSKEKKFY